METSFWIDDFNNYVIHVTGNNLHLTFNCYSSYRLASSPEFCLLQSASDLKSKQWNVVTYSHSYNKIQQRWPVYRHLRAKRRHWKLKARAYGNERKKTDKSRVKHFLPNSFWSRFFQITFNLQQCLMNLERPDKLVRCQQ